METKFLKNIRKYPQIQFLAFDFFEHLILPQFLLWFYLFYFIRFNYNVAQLVLESTDCSVSLWWLFFHFQDLNHWWLKDVFELVPNCTRPIDIKACIVLIILLFRLLFFITFISYFGALFDFWYRWIIWSRIDIGWWPQ